MRLHHLSVAIALLFGGCAGTPQFDRMWEDLARKQDALRAEVRSGQAVSDDQIMASARRLTAEHVAVRTELAVGLHDSDETITRQLSEPVLRERRSAMAAELDRLGPPSAEGAGEPAGLDAAVERYVSVVHPDTAGSAREEAVRAAGRAARDMLAERKEADRRRTHDAALEAIVAKGMRGENPAGDVRALAEATVALARPPVSGEARRVALRDVEAEIRRTAEARYREQLARRTSAREAELARLSATNLADMPREIRETAERNVANARPLFERRSPYRAPEPAVRAEEERIRGEVMRHQTILAANAQRERDWRQREAMRAQAITNCNTQAAVAGASVRTPYVSGRGGWLAAGIMGAIEQTATEARVRDACVRASGF